MENKKEKIWEGKKGQEEGEWGKDHLKMKEHQQEHNNKKNRKDE